MFKKRVTPTGLNMQNGVTGQRPLRLRRLNHSDEIVSGFAKLLKNESMTDVTLICNGGQTIRAHRVILSTFSPYFRAIFEAQPFSSNPCQFPVIVIKDLGLTELRAIVEFIYRGEVSVSRDKLPAILQAAKALEVSGLADLKSENFGISSADVSDELTGNSSLASLAALESAASGVKRMSTSSINDSTDEQLKKLKLSLENTNASMEQLLESTGSDFSSASGLDANVRNLFQNQINSAAASGLKVAQLNQQLNQHLNLAKQQKQLAQLMQQRQQLAAFKQQMLQQQLLKHASASGASSPSLAGRQSPARTLAGLNGASAAALQAKVKEKLAEKQQLQNHKLLQERLMQKSILNKHLRPIQEMHVGDGDETEALQLNGKSSENGDEATGDAESPQPNGELNDKMDPDDDCDEPTSIPVETRLEECEPNEGEDQELDDNERVANGLKDSIDDKSEGRRSSIDKSAENGSEKENADDDKNGDLNADDGANERSNGDADGVTLVDDEDLLQVAGEAVENDEDYDMEIDKDHVFQRQQQLRLLQLQKQQQFQAQLQMQLQVEEQEQKLLELNQLQQQLQAVAAAALQAGNGNASNGSNGASNNRSSNGDTLVTSNTDEPDESGFGFDWQEGFIDSGYSTCGNGGSGNAGSASSSLSSGNGLQFNSVDSPFGSKLSLLALGNGANVFGSGTGNSNNNNNNNGSGGNNNNGRDSGNSSNGNSTRQTPDFLQPRGPGRPRKGNKTQDISPCPQCNKVFVRPDVLKLHYRSVHLNERHPCNICPKIFKWPGDLSKHKRTKHPQEMAALAAAAAAQASARQLAKPAIKLS